MAANLEGPLVVEEAARFLVVDIKVSREFAVMYVPLYSMKIKAKGFEVKNR